MEIKLNGMRLLSVANRREHWAKTRRRNVDQWAEINLIYGRMLREYRHQLPATVTMIRQAPQLLDEGDNLPMAFKAMRDGIATALLPPTQGPKHARRGDDSDPRITWVYSQEQGPACVTIKIEHGE